MAPSGFDPITLNHWLWYKHQCHECSPADFQRLFEDIIKRARPEFIAIKPYGNIGDRKCDGLFFVDGIVFQVYSPDELTQAKVIAKIKEDLEGAANHWKGTLKKWVFVYNVRRGLPPDIPAVLQLQKKKYKKITLDHMSSDMLWEMARGLTLQQRAEVLGAPLGYDHLFLAPNVMPEDATRAVANGRFVLIHNTMSPINLKAVSDALAPAQSFGAPLSVTPKVGDLPWSSVAEEQCTMVEEAIRRGRDLIPRFAVFSFSQIPLAVHLGFTLSDRVHVDCYQFDRDMKSWNWTDDIVLNTNIQVAGLPSEENKVATEVVIRVSLSAPISPDDSRAVVPNAFEVDLTVNSPSVTWLRSPAQLVVLGATFRDVLHIIRERLPKVERIHLFYAGPTGGAIVIGQQINPRMNPPVETYEYSRQWNPRYRYALTISESRK